MKNINAEQNFILCYPILEKDCSAIIKKIKNIDTKKINAYELRLDYLECINERENYIVEIVNTINNVKLAFPQKTIIATIRSSAEGGKAYLTKDKLMYYIEEMCLRSYADYIDVEYALYKKYQKIIDEHFGWMHKKIIVSKHMFAKKINLKNCEKYLTDVKNKKCDIVKLAISVNSKKEFVSYMEFTKKWNKIISKYKKKNVFIAMGELGLTSRIFPEYNNTYIVFLNAYRKVKSRLAQPTLEEFEYYRDRIKPVVHKA